jgi:hypothetical protein
VQKVFSLLKNITFLIALCGSLLVSTVGFAIQTATLSAKVADLTLEVATISGNAAAAALQHRKTLAKAVTTTKAKARLRRVMVAVPIVGLGIAAEFERRDYLEWKESNPDGTFGDYSCEVATVSAEVVDDVLQDLPEKIRPKRDSVLNLVPKCPR